MTTKFLQSATGKRELAGMDLRKVHGNLSSDGNRAHRDNSIPALANDELTDRVNQCGLIPSQPRNRATVSRAALMDACKRAYELRDEKAKRLGLYPVMTIDMGLDLYWHSTMGENRADGHTEYKQRPAKVVTFGVNARYLMDALRGMQGETIEIDIPSPKAPFYVTDGTREASIMPTVIR